MLCMRERYWKGTNNNKDNLLIEEISKEIILFYIFSTVETISFKLIANPSTIDALIEGASLCVGLLFFNS